MKKAVNSQYQSFLKYLSERDIAMLDLILDKDVYSNVPKSIFMETLAEALAEFKDDPDLRFIHGKCSYSECSAIGKTGVVIIGSEKYLRLLIDMENDKVADVISCCQFECFERVIGKEDIYMDFYREDEVDFISSAAHLKLLQQTEKAIEELRQERILEKKFIEYWLQKHQTFKDGIDFPEGYSKLYIFTEIYQNLELIIEMLNRKTLIETDLDEYFDIEDDKEKILIWVNKFGEQDLSIFSRLRFVFDDINPENELIKLKKGIFFRFEDIGEILIFAEILFHQIWDSRAK